MDEKKEQALFSEGKRIKAILLYFTRLATELTQLKEAGKKGLQDSFGNRNSS